MTVTVDDPEMNSVVDPAESLEYLAGGCKWSEGPVYLPSIDGVLWSDIPNNRIMLWSESRGQSVYDTDVEFTNGHTLDQSGAIISCSHGNRRIERRHLDGTVEPLVDSFDDKHLNSPNDVVVKSDGTIWFTDPPYGIASDLEGHKAASEIGVNYVFRFDPRASVLSPVTDFVEEPNGLAFSPDESVLYVSDTSAALRTDGSGNHQIVAFDVGPGSQLSNPRVFAVVEPGLPDGFRVTSTGHLVTSCESGIQIFAPDGRKLGLIGVPEKTSNCAFGGPDGTTLFITASSSLYRIKMRVTGAVVS